MGTTPDEDVAVISTLAVHAATTLVASAWALGASPGARPTPGWVDPDVMPPPAAPTTVDWRTLATLDWRTGGTSDRLRSLDGTLVRIPGFAVPLQDFASRVTEFLVGPSGGGKTTLLGVLAGVLAASAGELEVRGATLTRMSGPKRDAFLDGINHARR